MVVVSRTLAQELDPAVISDRFDWVPSLFEGLEDDVQSVVPYLSLWGPAYETIQMLVDGLLPSSFSVGRGLSKKSFSYAMGYSSLVGGAVLDEKDEQLRSIGSSLLLGSSDMQKIKKLGTHFSTDQIECLLLSIGLKNFLGTLVDVLGCSHFDQGGAAQSRPLKQRASSHVYRKRLANSVSNRAGSVSLMLEESTGYSWPLLSSVSDRGARKALAFALRENLSREKSVLGLETKCLVGLVHARVTGNKVLHAEILRLASVLAPDLSEYKIRSVVAFADAESDGMHLSSTLCNVQSAAVSLARSASPVPCQLNEITVSVVGSELTPGQIIETLTWIAIQKMLACFYEFYE